MKNIWNYICYIHLLGKVCAVFGTELCTHSVAELNCKGLGGFYSNEEITKNGYVMLDSQKNSLNLEEGESAWISGHIEYSDFISWHGCYKENGIAVFKHYAPNFDITSCLKKCALHGSETITHIGIRKRRRNEWCYCLITTDITNKIEAIDTSKCNHQEPYNIKFNYTESAPEAISVYRILYQTRISYEHLGQCLFVKPYSNKLEYFASSCYTNVDLVSGFICINDYRNSMNSTCRSLYHSTSMPTAYCLQNKSTNWISANKLCNDLSGKLADNIFFQTAHKQIALKEKYWTGMFRSFELKKSASEACLAVTKADNKLVLDPDECSKKKKFICAESPGSTVSTWNSITTSRIPKISPTRDKNINYEGLIIALVVLALVTIAGSIIAFFAVRRYRNRSHHKRLQENVSASFSNGREGEADVNVSSADNPDPTLQNSTAKVKPIKPLRHTLKRQKNINTPYENYKLNPESSERFVRKESEDYDVVDLKSGKTKLLAVQINDESHVYNHTTVEGNCENYDTIRSAKSHHQLDCVTYSTLQRKRDDASDLEEQLIGAEIKINGKTLCDEANDNAAYDTMDEIKTGDEESVLPIEDLAEQITDVAE